MRAAQALDVEAQLSMWGSWARRTTDRLGFPNTSCISRMVEQVKVFKKEPEIGHVDPEKGGRFLTARGKQTRSMNAPKIGYVDPQIMAIDRIVADLPGEYKKMVYRRYVFGQPDRIAALQLRVGKDYYTTRANAAIQYVGEMLDMGTRYGTLA